ncbi:major capsid protein [Capybara microvirus Cap3_SP_316]|nr:major capsid protein [Capybara microvirus Cap3_SP_316]
MPQTSINEKFGSSGIPFDNSQDYYPKLSAFNLSRKINTTMDLGMLVPIDCIETVPNSRYEINIRYILNTFPLQVPPMTNYKIKFHYYFCNYESLWEDADTFVTRGRDNSVVLTKPFFNSSDISGLYSDDVSLHNPGDSYYINSPLSLLSYFGHPSTRFNGSSDSQNFLPFAKSDASLVENRHLLSKFSALQFLAYQKIYRSNYCSPNLLQSNKIWFPNNISNTHWRFSSDFSNMSPSGHFVPINSSLPSIPQSSFIPFCGSKNSSGKFEGGDNCVNLLQLRYVQFDTDRLNGSRPWLVRGTETSIETDISQISASLVDDIPIGSLGYPIGVSTPPVGVKYKDTNPYSEFQNGKLSLSSSTSPNPNQISIASDPSQQSVMLYALKKYANIEVSGNATLNLTANKVRTLLALSIKDEIDAMTNGNYNSRIKAQFGRSPKHNDFEPVYIGGTSDYINFSAITQTSQGSSSSPLGFQAGLGSGQNSGFICNFETKDFGYIIGVAFIVPESSYSDFAEHQWFDLSQDDVFWPIYAELGFEPILNKEVKISGDSSIDDDLFGYSTRYSWMKTRLNKNTGLFGLPQTSDLLFSAYSQSREFSETPKLSQEFLTASPLNTRRDFLQFPSLPAFRLQFSSDVRAILPLPYSSTPNRFGF